MIGVWLDRPGSVVHLADWTSAGPRLRVPCMFLGDLVRAAPSDDWHEGSGRRRGVVLGWSRCGTTDRRVCRACLHRLAWRFVNLCDTIDDYTPGLGARFADYAHQLAVDGWAGEPPS